MQLTRIPGLLIGLVLLVATGRQVRPFYYGIYTFATFVVLLSWLHVVFYLPVSLLLGKTAHPGANRSKLRRLLLTSFVALLCGELFLRNVLRRYPSYLEENGQSMYASQDREPLRTALVRPPREPEDHLWLILPRPHSAWSKAGPDFSFAHRYNSLGLRDDEPVMSKSPGENRIVALGDSFTEGVGTDEDSTWVKQLERQLNALGLKRRVRTINAGLAASDPFYEYLLLEKKLLAFDPDLVIVAVNATDVDNVRVRGGLERFGPDGSIVYRAGPRWEWLYGASYIVRHVAHDLLDYNWYLLKRSEMEMVESQSIDLLEEGLMLFAETSRAHEFELVIVVHPLKEELDEDFLHLQPLVDRLRSRDIRVVDLFDYYRSAEGIPAGKTGDYYWKLDGHHNLRGYELFARGLGRSLLEWRLVQ
jgi:hypothetical protein